MASYNHNDIEGKWQKKWEEEKLYRTQENGDKKFYILDMFPYPSGEGLHVGHPKGYIATDVYSRMKRMKGYDVLHPMGFDAFGLPAEQYALKNKVNPNISTAKNVARYKEQLKMLGLNYDWEREINTTDPAFYKWTQWMWKQMYKKGLAYESYDPINWCPSCKTGLANEDLENGLCERCGSVVEKKPLRQWTIRITDYADRLLADLDKLDWEPHIKELQKNWIGKSEGSEITFNLNNFSQQESLAVFTTRADTIFGATFMAISIELAEKWIASGWVASSDIALMIEEIKKDAKQLDFSFKEIAEKKGIDTGIKAINPATGKEIPVYIANYILSGYGTGAIMAVPAHDERDYEFAKKYDISINNVIAQETGVQQKNPEFRKSIVAVVYNPKTEKFLSLNWGTLGGSLLIGGGIDEGEDILSAALREIKEETGYANLKLLSKTGPIYHNYFAHSKNVARRIEATGFLFELVDELQGDIALEINEKNKFTLEWLSENDVLLKIEDELHSLIFVKTVAKNDLYVGKGILINSEGYDGLSSAEAKVKITEAVGGKLVSQYKLKDWTFARQRYWGEPFPIVFDENHTSYAVADKELPVVLPMVDEYEPTGTGESPLANIKEWVEVYGYINGDGEFESIRNYLKFEDTFVDEILSKKKVSTVRIDKKNLSVGCLIELKKQNGESFSYAKVISIEAKRFNELDIKNKNGTSYTSKEEQLASYRLYYGEYVNEETEFYCIDFCLSEIVPKKFRRETNTMPQWAGSSWYYLRYIDPHNDTRFVDADKEAKWSPVDFYVGGAEHATRHLIYARFWHKFMYDLGLVSHDEPFSKLQTVGLIMAEDGRKMSKRWGNVVNPDDIVREYGADTLRVYEMFMGPFDQSVAWNTKSMVGVKRFLDRTAKLSEVITDEADSKEVEFALHQTIQKVGDDIEAFKFNTAIAALMTLINVIEKEGKVNRNTYKRLILLIAPFAPHVTEELWRGVLDGESSVHRELWPIYDPQKLVTDTVTVAIQIGGKMRGTLEVSRDEDEKTLIHQVKNHENYIKYVGNLEPKKVIIIKNKIVNIVI